MIDIDKLIQLLKGKRKIYHSEDDLKLSFGMEISTLYPDCHVRLERPVDIEMIDWNDKPVIARAPIDVVVIEDNGEIIPIELKYKTKKIQLEHEHEKYQLTDHAAVDIGRYSFRKDIFRVEQFLAAHKNSRIGYVLIITNDKAYSDTDVSLKDNYDKFLSFHNGAVISRADRGWNYSKIDRNKYELQNGDKRWRYKNQNKNHWTSIRELFYKLDLKNDYLTEWNSYSLLKKTEFKYCLIRVNKN